MDQSGAVEPQNLGAACRDGRDDNRKMGSSLVDQSARRFAEARRRPRAIAVLLDESRMTMHFPCSGGLSLDLGQLGRRHPGPGIGLGQRLWLR